MRISRIANHHSFFHHVGLTGGLAGRSCAGNNIPSRRVKAKCTQHSCYSHHNHQHNCQQQQQQQQQRLYQTVAVTQSPAAYQVLGLPINSPFDDVKRAFVQLALQTHPDKQGGSTAQFLRVRHAFESIQNQVSGKGGGGGGPSGWSTEALREWWQEETGEFLHFDMCDNTRQEVIRAYHTMGSSAGRDKGGYWEMARNLAERDALMRQNAQGKNADKPVGRLEASSATNLRRRRRRENK